MRKIIAIFILTAYSLITNAQANLYMRVQLKNVVDSYSPVTQIDTIYKLRLYKLKLYRDYDVVKHYGDRNYKFCYNRDVIFDIDNMETDTRTIFATYVQEYFSDYSFPYPEFYFTNNKDGSATVIQFKIDSNRTVNNVHILKATDKFMQTQAISFLQSLPANIVNEMNPQVYYTFILKESIEDRNCMPEENPNTTYTKKLDRIRIFNLKKLWNFQTY